MFIILSQNSEAYAQAISGLIWAISRPVSARSQDDVTSLYCSWLVHSDGRVALKLPNTDSVPIHPGCDATALVDTIRAAILPAEADALESTINTNKGSRVNPVDLLPASLASQERTHDQMKEDGWFSEL